MSVIGFNEDKSMISDDVFGGCVYYMGCFEFEILFGLGVKEFGLCLLIFLDVGVVFGLKMLVL